MLACLVWGICERLDLHQFIKPACIRVPGQLGCLSIVMDADHLDPLLWWDWAPSWLLEVEVAGNRISKEINFPSPYVSFLSLELSFSGVKVQRNEIL